MNDFAVDLNANKASRKTFRAGLFIPLGVFVLFAAILGWGLTSDPKTVPSTLLGKPVPEFDLPPVKGRELGLASKNLQGKVSLVNVFASWCTACLQEHPIFMQLQKDGTVPLHGLNYKDTPDAAAKWLDKHGDPYTRTGADTNGRVGIEWGVYGVPETFLVGKDGRIHFKQIGPLTQDILEQKLMPVIRRLQRQ